METDIIQFWRGFDQRIGQMLELNQRNAAAVTRLKIDSLLASMKPVKIFAVAVGLVWVFFCTIMLAKLAMAGWNFVLSFFWVSMALQTAISIIAIAVYLYQLTLIGRVMIDSPVLETQKRLVRIKTSTLWVTRILFLQLPLWTVFFWNKTMFTNNAIISYILPVVIAVAFMAAAIWLFRNIRYENRHQKWFQFIFKGKEWTPLLEAMNLLEEIKEFENASE
jgi:hypothetical protein